MAGLFQFDPRIGQGNQALGQAFANTGQAIAQGILARQDRLDRLERIREEQDFQLALERQRVLAAQSAAQAQREFSAAESKRQREFERRQARRDFRRTERSKRAQFQREVGETKRKEAVGEKTIAEQRQFDLAKALVDRGLDASFMFGGDANQANRAASIGRIPRSSTEQGRIDEAVDRIAEFERQRLAIKEKENALKQIRENPGATREFAAQFMPGASEETLSAFQGVIDAAAEKQSRDAQVEIQQLEQNMLALASGKKVLADTDPSRGDIIIRRDMKGILTPFVDEKTAEQIAASVVSSPSDAAARVDLSKVKGITPGAIEDILELNRSRRASVAEAGRRTRREEIELEARERQERREREAEALRQGVRGLPPARPQVAADGSTAASVGRAPARPSATLGINPDSVIAQNPALTQQTFGLAGRVAGPFAPFAGFARANTQPAQPNRLTPQEEAFIASLAGPLGGRGQLTPQDERDLLALASEFGFGPRAVGSTGTSPPRLTSPQPAQPAQPNRLTPQEEALISGLGFAPGDLTPQDKRDLLALASEFGAIGQ